MGAEEGQTLLPQMVPTPSARCRLGSPRQVSHSSGTAPAGLSGRSCFSEVRISPSKAKRPVALCALRVCIGRTTQPLLQSYVSSASDLRRCLSRSLASETTQSSEVLDR